MTPVEFLAQYNLQNDIKRSTFEHYSWVVRSLTAFAGEVQLESLDEDLINRWLLSLRDNGLSPFTIHSRRCSMLVLWRAAAREGLATRPGEVRRIRLPDPAKDVWTGEEIAKLVSATDVLRKRFRGTKILRAPYFRTIIQAAYDTGLRQSDLHQVTVAGTEASGRLGILQQKTGRGVVVQFHGQTLEEIRRFLDGADREYVWPKWSRRRGTFARAFSRVVQAAELSGTFGRIRKTSGTEVERLERGAGWLHLGHCSPETARRWYLNAERAYDVDRPLPPPLEL